MLKCKEFYPADITPHFALMRKYEPVESVLVRINAWISSERIRVLNVETVSYCEYQQGGPPLIRVWYEE